MKINFLINDNEPDQELTNLFAYLKTVFISNSFYKTFEISFITTHTNNNLNLLREYDKRLYSGNTINIYFGFRSIQKLRFKNNILVLNNKIEEEYKNLQKNGFIEDVNYHHFVDNLRIFNKIIFTKAANYELSRHIDFTTNLFSVISIPTNREAIFRTSPKKIISLFKHNERKISDNQFLDKIGQGFTLHEKTKSNQFQNDDALISMHLFYNPLNTNFIVSPEFCALRGKYVFILIEKYHENPTLKRYLKRINQIQNIEVFHKYETLINSVENLYSVFESLEKSNLGINRIDYNYLTTISALAEQNCDDFIDQIVRD